MYTKQQRENTFVFLCGCNVYIPRKDGFRDHSCPSKKEVARFYVCGRVGCVDPPTQTAGYLTLKELMAVHAPCVNSARIPGLRAVLNTHKFIEPTYGTPIEAMREVARATIESGPPEVSVDQLANLMSEPTSLPINDGRPVDLDDSEAYAEWRSRLGYTDQHAELDNAGWSQEEVVSDDAWLDDLLS